jgi:NtrC-family two-component system sensor histidine kinase KinB
MKVTRLATRFQLAGSILVASTVACGLWSVIAFARLSHTVDESLRASQHAEDLAAQLATALEREDDALLLSISGDVQRARRDLANQRATFDQGYAALASALNEPDERDVAASLMQNVSAYRAAGDALVNGTRQPDASTRYQTYVNPLLRRSVADCSRLRELELKATQAVGIQARDAAWRSTWIVAFISLVALTISVVVSIHLSRTVVTPIRELTASVEALRAGDFDRRTAVTGADEVGRLSDGFNRMAEALGDFRRSNLGEVLRAKETLEATLAALPEAVLVIGPDEGLESVNPPARAFLRASGLEHAQRLSDLGLSAAAVEAVRGALGGRRDEATSGDFSRALTLVMEGGARRLLPIAAPIRELTPGRAGAVLVLYDVTDFARIDELRTDLIGVASHELKTPITTLRMDLMLLGEDAEALTPRQREIVSTALLGCEQLAGTVDELLDLTRIEAGELRLDTELFDLSSAFFRMMDTLIPRFAEAGIRLRLAETTEAFVRGDPARLELVLSNLLGNALKYTPPSGSVEVEMSSRHDAGSRRPGRLQIAVTDTGPGIPEEYRERVFEKFFRVENKDPEGAGHAKGAGIGLYLCRQIVEAHAGTIRCESGEGDRGTRFVIDLPAEPVERTLKVMAG